MLTRLVRIQLGIFAVVTVLAVGAISILYLHAPSRLGIGTYKVTADFIGGGGIYKSANVTYRGVTVGRVGDVHLTDHGVDAEMRLNSGTKIPDNVFAGAIRKLPNLRRLVLRLVHSAYTLCSLTIREGDPRSWVRKQWPLRRNASSFKCSTSTTRALRRRHWHRSSYPAPRLCRS